MRIDPFRILCSIAFAFVVAARGLAADPLPATPNVNTMTMQQLLAEFHGPAELCRPVSQRRVDVVNAIRHLGLPLIDALRADMGNADTEVRIRGLRVLLCLGSKGRPLLPEVMGAAADSRPDIRSAALRVLCNLRDPSAFEVILQATRDPNAEVRSIAIRNGRAVLADAPFAVAIGALKDIDIDVRVAAVQGLSWLKDKRAVIRLAPLLDDQTILHHDVRDGVTTTHRMCDEAVAALEFLVNDVYLLPGNKTQKDYDELVQHWQTWREEKGQKFDAVLYDEPVLKKADRRTHRLAKSSGCVLAPTINRQ